MRAQRLAVQQAFHFAVTITRPEMVTVVTIPPRRAADHEMPLPMLRPSASPRGGPSLPVARPGAGLSVPGDTPG